MPAVTIHSDSEAQENKIFQFSFSPIYLSRMINKCSIYDNKKWMKWNTGLI